MKYMLLMYTNPEEAIKKPEEALKKIGLKHKKLLNELKRTEQIISGSGLWLPKDTKTLHLGSDTVDAQLPVADTKKQMTAYYVVECDTEQAALDIAKTILDDHVTDVEVRG